ncbi:katanin p80 WD40 repeat-containing subunit B1-like [Clytia hemisphaerica]|uniref:Katanin p80 WD40 repeat-containing subunit B1 n=1 Tax=Clytia hemisphaerica TaxID=252671 RepID=A0A7M5V0L0_9CNID
MSSSSKRSWKLQEFVAHSSNVTCLSIGPSSGRVMVTGGEDKKVNMWAIGKPNVILSLSGHTTPIECVQFNNSEELVCAGSSSGALKIWDLDSAKVVRTLTGHKANIKSLDFHPYGEFIASGSMDTTVRLWDIRRKGCIVSYKGHTNTVNHLRFSPDGRWVISAGEDGIVKLWDLNAGKLLADFILHTGPVNCVEFHPREFLIATGSSDRTVKYWDLETFGLISSSDLEASPVRTVCFHPEGVCLFSGGQDSLRAHLWEPSVCFDSQTLGWGKITDMAFSSNQLIGASYQATNVSVWVSSMNNIETMAEKANAETYVGKVEVNQSVQQINSRKHSPPRKSFPARPKTQSSKSRKTEKQSQQSNEEFSKAVDDKLSNPAANYDNIFQPSTALSRSPESKRKQTSEPVTRKQAPETAPSKPVEPPPKAEPTNNRYKVENISKPAPQKAFYHPSDISQPQTPFQPPDQDLPPENNEFPVQYQQPTQRPVTTQKAKKTSIVPPPQPQAPPSAVEEKMHGLKLNDFSTKNEKSRVSTPNDEESTLEVLGKSHGSLCQIMQARLQNLSLVSHLWTEGDIKGAINTASSMSDLSVFVDLVNVLVLKPALWNLELCGVILPQLKNLLASNYESYIESASASIKLILKNFAQLIKNTLSIPPGALGVDLSREERHNKCNKCNIVLLEIRNVVSGRSQVSGRIGSLCRELSLALSVMD